jgi:hypothetical protein
MIFQPSARLVAGRERGDVVVIGHKVPFQSFPCVPVRLYHKNAQPDI